jgi:putative protease
MSPKDLKTIHFLNKMLDAGVRVLKIEGRARGAEYVDTVVRCYKEAVEAWQRGEYSDNALILPRIADWNERLSRVFNRGFWDGYYQGQKLGEWTHVYGNKATRKKVYAAKCTNFFKNLSVAEFLVEAVDTITEGTDLLITGETTGVYECKAQDMRDTKGQPAGQVHKGNYFSLKTDTLVRRGDKLFIWEKA